MKKILMIALFTSVFVGITLIALAVERHPPRLPQPTGENSCTGYPVISSVEVLPNNLWAPTEKDVTIEISGVVNAADNCEIETVSLVLKTDKGFNVSTISPPYVGGIFSGTLSVSVSKEGKLKEGTTYNGTIMATDSEGHMSSRVFSVTVLHDRGTNKHK